jgi:penicillin-binding protein 1B
MWEAAVNFVRMMIRRVKRLVPASNGSRGWLKAVFFLFVCFTIVALIFTFQLYFSCKKIVDAHLKTDRWSLPSTIYADAPMLYEGMPLKEAWLVEYLQRLNYQKTTDSSPGTAQFAVLKNGIAFKKRALFKTQSKIAPVLIQFEKDGISKILNVDNKEELPAFDLEPAAISSLFGSEWEKRTLIQFQDLPKPLVQAVIAIEDRRFYQHGAIDVKAIVRAIVNDLMGRKQLQGGSTITQQLVKNFYLTPARTIRRKLSEAMMAWIMERRQSKDEILEMYLNEIYLGQRGAMSINGVGEASLLFFRKDVQHITTPEAALLAGLIQAPNLYNPYKNPVQARSRRDTVLLAMKNTGALSDKEYEQHVKVPLVVHPYDARVNLAPYFGDVVKSQLLDKYKEDTIYTQNLHIFTTLDLDMQRYAEESLSKGLAEIDKLRFKRTKQNAQGCLIAIEPQTGYIRAFVGGRSYSKSQFDRISKASRQPGSVFKPVVYATALEQAFAGKSRVFTPATIVVDEPWTLHYANQTWEPKNYDGQYHGSTTLRNALAQSMNVATAKLAMDVGLKEIANLGKNLGFESVKPFPSLALGAFEVSPWQVATAFTVFANGGVKTELRTVKKVAGADGKTLERSQIEVERVLHPQTAYILTDMMETVLSSGTGAPVRRWGFTRPAAGKTGTTDEYRDAWFVGYTPNLLCVVWTGYDDNTPIKMTGAQAALPIWAQFMKKAVQNLPAEDFASPQGVVVVMIDPMTGQLATEDCPSAVPEKFVSGTEPTQTCQEHSSHWWKIFG